MDYSSLLAVHALQRTRTSRQRLYGVSEEDVSNVVQSSNVEHHAAAPASQVQSLPESSSGPGTVEGQPQVAPGTSTGPVAGLTSQDIPGTVADFREIDSRFQSFPGPGADAAVVEPHPQAAKSTVVVHATVEPQPSVSRDLNSTTGRQRF